MPQDIATALRSAISGVLTPLLDAEVLLAHVLAVPRSHIHSHPERLLTEKEQEAFMALVERRACGEPIAYLTGQQEFWSLKIKVTPDTLIPRPETEQLIELLLQRYHGVEKKVVADLGTGSGAIALALAREKPTWDIYASDNSAAALRVAEQNAVDLHINNVTFCSGHWCEALAKMSFDIMVSNPPYVADDDPALQPSVVNYEPRFAVIAAHHGLSELHHIIQQAPAYLKVNGYLFLEHGFQQAVQVRRWFLMKGYRDIVTVQDLALLDRITFGRWPG